MNACHLTPFTDVWSSCMVQETVDDDVGHSSTCNAGAALTAVPTDFAADTEGSGARCRLATRELAFGQ